MVHLTIRNDPDEIFLFVDKATAIVSIRFGCTQHNSDRKSTRLNSSHSQISYAVFCLKEHTSELQSQSNLVCRLLLKRQQLVALDRVPDDPPVTYPFCPATAPTPQWRILYCTSTAVPS